MVMSTVAVKKVNGEKLKIMEQQAQENATLLENVLGTSNSMVSGIGEVVEKMKHMGESVTHIRESMNQVSAGSTETAESVMAQMLRTEQIQQHIVNVKESTAGIEQNMAETERRVEEGMQQMNALSQQVDISISANKEMLEKMNALREYSNQMNTIIDTINSIAGSTGMLALNASIEAARAGESGKGFAVVASEISNLANQTKMATVDITKLIENIKKELQSVIEAVDVVTDSNHASENNTQVVTDSFDGIAGETKHIGEQTRELLDIVESLKTANADIVENIRTISAIVEEVSAHANETYNACEENSRLVDSVTEIVQELNDDAQKLQRFSKE
jgi:methyl-accepting chemotaxis protein